MILVEEVDEKMPDCKVMRKWKIKESRNGKMGNAEAPKKDGEEDE